MLKLIIQLLHLLTPQQKKQLLRLQLVVFICSVLEVASLASVSLVIGVASNPKINLSGPIFKYFPFVLAHSHQKLLLMTGSAVFTLLLISTIISVYTTWRLSLFSNRIGVEIGDRLFEHYLYQNWTFHATQNSADLTKKITAETTRVTNQILNPLIQMNAKIFTSVMLLTTLTIFNPLIALTILCIFSSAYLLIYKTVRSRLLDNGRKISQLLTARYKIISEGLGGIKDLLITGRQEKVVDAFNHAGVQIAKRQANNQTLIMAPRSLMELVVYGSIVLIVLIISSFYKNNLATVMQVLSIYALAGVKLLPAFQQIYTSFSSITANVGAFENIYIELKQSQTRGQGHLPDETSRVGSLLKKSISFKHIHYKYPEKTTLALKDIHLEIPAYQVTGIIGASGSGKSTLIDILLGLLEPSQGCVTIDNQTLDASLLPAWQKSVGYVPQHIYLTDASIKHNIAIGLEDHEIDESRIIETLQLAQLDVFVNNLPNGIHSMVGERGVQLSGGQRQRIGIARALYQNPDILIFDEATSALDQQTEKLIIQSVESLSGNRTIIMVAHRLTTLSPCHKIVELANGTVVRETNYQNIIKEQNT